jgi:hypothetical protein
MYDRADKAELNAKGLWLTGPHKFSCQIEREQCFLMLESTELSVRSELRWPFLLDNWPPLPEKEEPPTSRTTISAKLRPARANLFAFKGDRFLGRIEGASLHCASGTKDYFNSIIVHPETDDFADQTELHISGVLTEEHFKELFHPIWLRQAKSILDVTVLLDGFQSGAEASFHEPGETVNFVFNAAGGIQTAIHSLALRTPLS